MPRRILRGGVKKAKMLPSPFLPTLPNKSFSPFFGKASLLELAVAGGRGKQEVLAPFPPIIQGSTCEEANEGCGTYEERGPIDYSDADVVGGDVDRDEHVCDEDATCLQG